MPEVLTAHLGLPIPHETLQLDLPRIQDALTMIDSKFQALDTLLGSNDISLDTVQELVDAIKAARSELGLLQTSVANQIAAETVSINTALATQSASFAAQLTALASALNTAVSTMRLTNLLQITL